MCRYSHLLASFGGSVNIYMKEVFFATNLSLGRSHVGPLFTVAVKAVSITCYKLVAQTVVMLNIH